MGFATQVAISVVLCLVSYPFTFTLDATHPRDRVRGTPCRVFTLRLEKGKCYQIDMKDIGSEYWRSRYPFDPYLRLEDKDGNHIESDDDSGEGLNARIIFICKKTDNYRIIATTFDGGPGYYFLWISVKR